ncbi:bifunctional diguanylate cyclase/phosphodiesterase [Dryocola clanedunensis]
MQGSQKRYPITFANMLIFGVSLCAVVLIGVVFVLQQQGMHSWFTQTTQKTLSEKSQYISHRIEMYLDKPRLAGILLSHLDSVADNISSPTMEKELQHVLEEDFAGQESISRIGIASPNGQYIAFQRHPVSGKVFLIKNTPADTQRVTVYRGANEHSGVANSVDSFNVYSRPWYIRAQSSSSPFWTKSYYHMVANDGQVIGYRMPVRQKNNAFSGVIFADIYTSVLNDYLVKLAPTSDSTLLLVDEKQQIIASSKSSWRAKRNDIVQGENAKLSTVSVFPRLNALLQDASWGTNSSRKVSQQGKNYYVLTHPVRDESKLLGWTLVIITPESLPSGMLKHTDARIFLSLAALIVLFVLAFIIMVRQFSRPLNRLVEKTRLLGQQPWEPAGNQRLYPEIAVLEEELSSTSSFISGMIGEQKKRIENDNATGLLTRAGLFNEPTLYSNRNLMLMIRVTNFRDVRSTLGHTHSQRFIKFFADQIVQLSPDGSIFCRYSEDLFIVVFPEHNERKDLDTYWDQLSSLFQGTPDSRERTDAEGRTYIYTGQAGAALATLSEETITDCMMNAGLALQQGRLGANGECVLFTPEMRETELNNIKLHQALREDLQNDGFHLVMQPIVSLDNARTFSEGECLIRWNSPTLGFVPPDKFIGLAERTGMITDLGRWIIEEACRQLAAFIARGAPEDFKLHINISAVQFQQSDFSDHLLNCMLQNGLMNKNICLEITESVLLQNSNRVIETLSYLRRLGLSVAIDDFGSGYSSLSYLHQLPFDCLKIDRGFVNGLMDDKKSEAVISSVIMLSQRFGVPLVAEGIETLEMGLKLREMGCEKAQGYYYGRPQPFENWIPLDGVVGL